MGLFDHAGTTPREVLTAAKLAHAAYKGNVVPDGWTPLTAAKLGYDGGSFAGRFDGYYFNSGILAPGGSAIVLRQGDQLAISFRGTDDDADRAAYATLGNNSYIDRFASLLEAVARYAADNDIAGLLVTGQSLGAAAANILRDVAADFGAVFETATYITFATPKVAVSRKILNVGFENDGVFKYVARHDLQPGSDFASTTDNIVVFDDAYADPSWPGLVFGLGDATVHGSAIDVDVVGRVSSSSFYREMTRDSVVVVVATDKQVTDKAVRTSDHYGKPAYFIGRDGAADNILGGVAADTMEGFGGNDTLAGMGGKDRLKGGGGEDVLNGRRGDDFLDGGRGNDLLKGRRGDDVLDGRRGNDLIKGGSGDDALSGGTQADVFIFSPGSGSDYIADFTDSGGARDDRIDVRAYNFTRAGQITKIVSGDDLILDFGGGDTTTIVDYLATHSANQINNDILI